MPRKTGEDVKIEVEIGTTYYAMAALSTVSSPSSDVGKVYQTSATYLSDQKSLQPDVRLDGVISGFNITPGSGYNEVDISAGSAYIKGDEVEVSATTIGDIPRPLVDGNVLVTALSVDEDGNVNRTECTEGSAGGSRGAAGGKPNIPTDEVLIGYITMDYYGGSVSGSKAITSDEIDNESKERTTIPSYKIHYHDGEGGRDNYTGVGAIEFYTQLPTIHSATATGDAAGRRNVYASYYAADFEELGDAYDFDFDETIESVTSRAYQDLADEMTPTVPSWSGSGSVYFTKVKDALDVVRASKRWVKYYPDKDNTDHWVGRAILTVSRALPVADNMVASVTLEGSGKLYSKQS